MDRVEHGLLSTYVRCRCTCPQCAAASRDYARARTRARAYGQIPPLVDVGTVRAHLGPLAEQGIGEAQVAALSGIGRSVDNAAAAARVDATGSRRRLQALVFTGWPLTIMQQRLGLVRLDRVLAAGTAAAARAVWAFYDTHWDHPPAVSTPQGRRAVTLARARAARAAFVPALAWDDDTIDDPRTVPDPPAVRPQQPSPPRVHLEDVEMLARLGATCTEVQARTGARRTSIETACARAGRRDLVARITSNRRVAA